MPLPPGEFAPPRDEMAESTAMWRRICKSARSAAMSVSGERYLHGFHQPSCNCLSAERRVSRPAALSRPEAALKVLRPLISRSRRSIEVARNPGGWCYLRCTADASPANQAGFVAFSLSMSHEGAYARGRRGATPQDQRRRLKRSALSS
jgi:hypothetical protein